MRRKILVICLFLALIFPTGFAFGLVINGSDREVSVESARIGGARYIPLIAVCDAYGIKWDWDSTAGIVILQKNELSATMQVGSRYLLSSAGVQSLEKPIEMKDGGVMVPLSFGKKTVKEIFEPRIYEEKVSKVAPAKKSKTIPKSRAARTAAQYRIETIVIDPGHGGKDPGAIGKYGLKEKDVTLAVSKQLREELELCDIKAVLTRQTDKFIPLWQRTAIANREKADLFVSIHVNASRARGVNGFEVYYLSDATDDSSRALAKAENGVVAFEDAGEGRYFSNLNAILWDLRLHENRIESIELGDYISRVASRELGMKNRGTKGARFYVFKDAEMPAILVEMGYISNVKEETKLETDAYKEKMAEAVAAGILAFKDEYERTNGFSE